MHMQKKLKIKVIFLILISIFLPDILNAQMELERDNNMIFDENSSILNSALGGGINAAQFSNLDVNLDGVMDIFVFDKSGNRISTFINDNGSYKYAPEYRQFFPKLYDWAILADYNCDGKNDIFTYKTGGIVVYLNTSNTELEFTQITTADTVSDLIQSDYGAIFMNIYVSPVDIPAIADIDYDGDLDILTFSILGGFVDYHKNLSMELYGHCDSLAFELSESCWGLFYEGLNSYILNCQSCQCPQISPSTQQKQKHAGSTLLAIDVDNDNDKDLILGDISYNNLNLLINGGDNQNAIITSVDSVFPKNYNNTIPADINVYPAAYYLDITNDGIKDLIVTTNSANNSENFKSCWAYENIGQNTLPSFNFIEEDFLQKDMLDFGTSALPTFYDYNNDGLKDLVIGNYGYHSPNNNPISSLALLENTGTDSLPKFTLISRDWLSLSSINLNTILNIPALNLTPTFGDLNGDNYSELILGDADGKLHLFNNNGSGSFQLSIQNYQNIDVGQFAQPQLIDVNRDGKTDLIIGEQDGTINYLPNSGTISNAIFDTIIKNWGSIDVDSNLISTGFSSPKLYDSSGVYQLFIGSFSGKIYQYGNIENNLDGQFTEINSIASNIWDGGRSSVALADINFDNKFDMIVGNIAGGIAFFSSDTAINITTSNNYELYKEILVKISPNPTKNSIKIISTEIGLLNIYNSYGSIIFSTKKNKDELTINLSSIKKGIYFVELNKIVNKLIIE